jgi:hypothetical protein
VVLLADLEHALGVPASGSGQAWMHKLGANGAHKGYFRRFPALGRGMKPILALTLVLAGCTASGGPPDHPLVGSWQGEKALTLGNTDYRFGSETGYWSATRSEFRYKQESGAQERCDFSLNGRTLVMSSCRLAGRYTRMQ